MSRYTQSLPIHPITVPTPFPVGPVHTYLIKSDPITLIDCGLDRPECRQALAAGLAEHGLEPADIRRVILTHAHVDHMGLAAWFQEQGAELYLHRLDQGKAAAADWWKAARRELLAALGVPAAVQQAMRQVFVSGARMVLPLAAPPTLLEDGDAISFDGFSLSVMHTPGHCLGHVAYWWEDQQVLFGGDLLLAGISPNPLPEPLPEGGHALTLQQFLDSLDRVDPLPVQVVYPGHGPLITDHRAISAGYRRHHAARMDEIAAALPPEGVTAFALTGRLYPHVADWNIFLALSEVFAHLELLVHRGRARTVADDEGLTLFLPAGLEG